jgi:hypothetical protein
MPKIVTALGWEAASAPWRSGYAAACKAVYTGSIPVGASARNLRGRVRGHEPRPAHECLQNVTELVAGAG